jgi:hypothetical protein
MEEVQQLEIECPFCGGMQPRESAQWDERDVGYVTICERCGKVFSGLTVLPTYIGCPEHWNS